MAHTVALKTGETITLFGMRDMLELVEEYIGTEARWWMEEWIRDITDECCVEDLEEENKGLREHHKEVMEKLREQSEIIAGLIRKKEIDRKKLSAAAGQIGIITLREGR